MAPDRPQHRDVPLAWVGYDETPIIYANQFLIQIQPEGSFVIGVGQSTPPALIGTQEQIEEQAMEIEFVAVRPLTRVAITEDKMRELIAALGANLANFDKFRKLVDPRGGERTCQLSSIREPRSSLL
jgi:hypothetical protein